MIIFAFTALSAVNLYAGYPLNETDSEWRQLVGVFDLRDRETFIQVTHTDEGESTPGDLVHIQVFNLAQSCGENNFFDAYTTNDTHVYNIRNLTTNDGSDPGFTLPDNSYGFVVVTFEDDQGIGNMRIKDANGYEYRTNLQATDNDDDEGPDDDEHWFNFNQEAGVVFSDIFGVMVSEVDSFNDGVILGPITESYVAFNVELLDLNEVLFSCTDLVFACTDGTDPLIPELLDDIAEENNEDLGTISSVNVEFGINETIPSSKGAPLLCPNNTINAGTVFFNEEEHEGQDDYAFIMFVGLNDGNGRGSFDSVWSGENVFAENWENP